MNLEILGTEQAPPTGMYFDVPEQDYRNWAAVNQSLLKEVSKTPSKALYALQNPSEPTDGQRLGTLFHSLTTHPVESSALYVCRPTVYTPVKKNGEPELDDSGDPVKKPWNWNAKVCKQWKAEAEAAGKIVVSRGDLTTAQTMADKIRSHPEVASRFGDARHEVSIVWKDVSKKNTTMPTGLICKARLDSLVVNRDRAFIIDYKTSSKPLRAYPWIKTSMNFGYYTQAAFYIDAVRAVCEDVKTVTFLFAAVETFPPHDTRAFMVQESDEIGGFSAFAVNSCRRENEVNLWRLNNAIESGEWPGYDPEPIDMCDEENFPSYAFTGE